MKKLIIALGVLVIVVALLGFFFYGVVRGGHRASFILALNELSEANVQLQKHGTFTNYSSNAKVYPCTNRFNIAGRIYECQLAVESVDLYLRDRGLLTITTNNFIVWVDKKRGAMLLGHKSFNFPPGL